MIKRVAYSGAMRCLIASLTAFASALSMVACVPTPVQEASAPASATAEAVDVPAAATRLPGEPMVIAIEGTPHTMTFVPVEVNGHTLWVATHETVWELYDTLVFKFDHKSGTSGSAAADAVTRPTKPYVAADRGFGHNGYPAVSISFGGAKAFCEWLSAKTGKTVRLPTQAEREAIAAAADVPDDSLAEIAWFKANAGTATRKVGQLKADRLGLYDVLGNVGECAVASDGSGVIMGGCFEEPVSDLEPADARAATDDWNASDPQFPKSIWWLTDAPFAGFRVVIEQSPE